ncbi:MAG: ABC-2 family transporter protein [Myxococcales bacterium]|nr:ABC-2 family transporter protein [Myxococcales bacterium]
MPEVRDEQGRRWGLRRHLRLIGASLRVSLLAALEYRVGFWSEALIGMLWSAAGMVPLLVAFEHRSEVGGWSGGQVVMLAGFYMMLAGTFAALLQPALFATMDHIRRGTLDYVLLRPVDSLVSSLVSAFAPWSLLEVLAGAGVVTFAALQLDLHPGPAELASLAAALLSGFLALYALGVLVLSLSFRAMQLQNLAFLMESMLELARWPITVFRGPLRLLFTFLIPFAVMTSYPAQALFGTLGPRVLLGALASTAALALLARLAWQRGLRGYTSASS